MQNIRKLLIANRGEIACRVMRTCEAQNIRTVAVFSEADRDALHVKMADEAVFIGSAAASESYLVGDKIIAVAKQTGADAIHPGYGFLSENPEFAEACEAAGIIFIGPSAQSMRAMALKGAAKKLMEDADVPVVPGYHGDDQSLETLTAEAQRIGYPVLIKAVAGGGGKGMRQVAKADELPAAVEAARREGENSFGNGTLLIEKLITKPRHIEVQVFGGSDGKAVYLWERDCSLQRRHQKVVEEAPAPGMSAAMREQMGLAAVRAAEATGYQGAGTVEFIADVSNGLKEDAFYFMEMNTRLQVEHPVTELITGQDLVSWQISVAEGKPLPLNQEEINANVSGHAVEVRLYAEDPENDFRPAIGDVHLFDAFAYVGEGQRIDAGVTAGDSVSIHYDPMIAKLIAFGENRDAALDNLASLVRETPIHGLTTNRDFLLRSIQHPEFRAGDLHTGFIEAYKDTLIPERSISSRDYALAALAILERRNENTFVVDSDPWAITDSFRLNLPKQEHLLFDSESDVIDVSVAALNDGTYEITVGEETFVGKAIDFDANGEAGGALTVLLNGHIERLFAYVDDTDVAIIGEHTVNLKRHQRAGAVDEDADGPGTVTAPMPGKILDIKVENGDVVEKGDALIVIEAMKMEQSLTAARGGTVQNLHAAVGDQIDGGATLLVIEDN